MSGEQYYLATKVTTYSRHPLLVARKYTGILGSDVFVPLIYVIHGIYDVLAGYFFGLLRIIVIAVNCCHNDPSKLNRKKALC